MPHKKVKQEMSSLYDMGFIVEKIKLNISNGQRRGKAGSLVSYRNLTNLGSAFLHIFFSPDNRGKTIGDCP